MSWKCLGFFFMGTARIQRIPGIGFVFLKAHSLFDDAFGKRHIIVVPTKKD